MTQVTAKWRENMEMYPYSLGCIGTLPCFSVIFNKGNNFRDSFASLADMALPNWGLL